MGATQPVEVRLAEIKALFWDVGGVLLTNAWDHTQREEVLARFQLDRKEFSERHDLVVSSFERGKITLDEYLDRTVFYQPRAFSRDEFKSCVYEQSKADPEALSLAKGLADSGKYLMGTINNESRELNVYRIEKFGMRSIFKVFVSSCFVGLRKPEEAIYRLALDITQQMADACCLIDDRALNLEVAKRLGMHTIEMDDVKQLREDLRKLGVG
jgi:putative hydrolase of the HAD superfamily